MRCPNCNSLDDKVIETRISKEGDVIRRRRQCVSCGHRFTTYETVIPAELIVVKKDKSKEDFKPEKILYGISQAFWKRSISKEQIDQMVARISMRASSEVSANSEITSQKIGELVMEELKKVDEVAYVRYASVYRHFQDAEAFLNEIQSLTAHNDNDTKE